MYVSRVLDMRDPHLDHFCLFSLPFWYHPLQNCDLFLNYYCYTYIHTHMHTCIYNLWSLFSDALCACLQSRSQHAYDWLVDNSLWNATGLWNGLLLMGFVTPFSSQLASDVNISISHFSPSHSCHGIQQLCLRLSLNLTNKMVPVHFLDYQHNIHSPLH